MGKRDRITLKYMKRCSFTIVMEVQVNFTEIAFLRLLDLQRSKHMICWWGFWENKHFTHDPEECWLVQLPWRLIWLCSAKQEMQISFDTAIPFLEMFSIDQGYSVLALSLNNILGWIILCYEFVICLVGYLASLAPLTKASGTSFPRYDNQNFLQTLPMMGKIAPG